MIIEIALGLLLGVVFIALFACLLVALYVFTQKPKKTSLKAKKHDIQKWFNEVGE